jgi:hypothetical protein
MPQLEIMSSACDKFYNGSGFSCDIKFKYLNDTKMPTIRVMFLSSGKITGTSNGVDDSHVLTPSDRLITLKSGGTIVLTSKNVYNGCEFSGCLLDYNNKVLLNKTIHTNITCDGVAYNFMDNNTVILVQDIKKDHYTLLTENLPIVMIGNYYLFYFYFLSKTFL